MTKNNIDVSTLTVSSASIALTSASPAYDGALKKATHSALISALDGDVYWRDNGDDATNADDRLNQFDQLVIEGERGAYMTSILDSLRFLRVSGDVKLVIHWFD